MFRFALLSVFASAFALAEDKAEEKHIVDLTSGESATIQYTSSGCFHDARYRFVISGGDSVTATVYQSTWHADTKTLTEAAVGETTLDADATKGLDGLLAHYRSHPAGGCTTVETVSIRWEPGGVEQTYTDASCSRSTSDGYSFEKLIEQAQENQKK